MTDTKAPSPWFEVIKGLMPSLNQGLIVIVTAVVSIGGTYAAAHMASPPPPAPRMVEVIKTVPNGTLQACEAAASDLKALRNEFSEFAARKGKRKVATATAK